MHDAASKSPAPVDPPPLRSVHTVSFPRILDDWSSSVLVTTYQAGKLVILRNHQGVLNTHFRDFAKPMGLAVAPGRLAVGTNVEIWEFHNVPAVCRKLPTSAADNSNEVQKAAEHQQSDGQFVEPDCDACYLPRKANYTGDVQIHEMAWIEDELWFVNTAFSCLSIRSERYSFEPRWRPSFIKKLIPGDCCHLNGLAVRNGRPAYVTALAETSTPGAWRELKRDGGVVIDVESDEIIARGLSMPHSPRWYQGNLWLLESGDGSLGRLDLNTGRYEAIAKLPGFTRGLTFLGQVALVGLSQVRESAVFSGIPLVERLHERICGVWLVNIETGQTIGFVRFEDAVQEIFAVEALGGVRYPDVINHDLEIIGRSYVLGDDALALVPEELQSN
jgi:uncharacterized protein (TIGR03032 family)